ncbi:polysaccharide biosynthesis protein [Sulfuriferula nivalis]|uniref:Nucleoside-diphosphate sugar oxidoreductase n=1 Tax=Sulfuriferula nivalis TaxID=2675298 RepID=A0A809SGG0_9PROT|nr:nucleoside-diphosphate sugar epimerase/dehydratase [Sulfuriferula nivalis]BBO99899.1 nucleoside-diphosphate sugar oxidoreductase [Sulfuriferula nivalis]
MVSRFNTRILLAFLHDLTAAGLAWLVAYWLRFNLSIPAEYWPSALSTLAWVMPLQALAFWRFGLYRGIWRFASLPDLRRILFAVGVAALLIPLALFMFQIKAIVPRSVLVLDPILLLLIMGGSRLTYRAWKEHRFGALATEREPVIILGAGGAAASLVRELAQSREWRVVGLLDDMPTKQGRDLYGVPVLGKLDSLARHAEKLNVQHAVIAMPSTSHSVRRHAAQICADAGIAALTVPAFDDLASGKVTVSALRKIELDDLLGRDPVQLDDAGLQQLIHNQVVMVSGAGGSIGSELCRQIARFQPKLLILFEMSEFALYKIEQEFNTEFPDVHILCAIGDVKHAAVIDSLLSQHQPSVIFHAAAYKHVPLMEQSNAWQAMRNNVLGTYMLAHAAQRHGVAKFVLISTDKAVNPTNVMGASKRLAEMVCQSLHAAPTDTSRTRFVAVRFGNVLGSSGSVIPKFQEQIAHGGPITVTHPDITRYFMSIPEACQLVLQAGLMGDGGEIFVLDMGEPVKIADLARDMIKLSGFSENDIKIVYSGLRPGEKLYEELLADDEHTLTTPHPKLRIAQARTVEDAWLSQALIWLTQEHIVSEAEVKQMLKKWVPEYTTQT